MYTCHNYDKKAVLPQRWPRNAPYTWVPWKFSGLPDYIRQRLVLPTFSRAFVPIGPVRHRSQSHKWKRLTGEQYDWLATWSRLGVAKWLMAAWVKYDWRRRLSRTRKLCYRKDDRAMRPTHWCPEKFRDSLTTPTATIPNIFHGLLFGSTLWMFLQNLNFVALPVPEIIGGTQKIGQSLDMPTLPFLQNF